MSKVATLIIIIIEIQIIIIIIIVIMMTLFRCPIYLASQRPTNWGHHLYHSKVDGDLSHEGHTYKYTRLQRPTV